MLMPTAMKNRPSSRPLNGSMSVSSSRRYSLSASSTPARKAPSAIDRPTACISAAVATTSSSDAAVKISGVRLRAIQRSAGRSSSRPPSRKAAITATALAAASQPPPSACAPATRQQRQQGQDRDRRHVLEQHHAEHALAGGRRLQVALGRTASPIAVDDIARPSDAASATGQATPQATAMPSSAARAEASTCSEPQPKIGRRIAHRRRGSSSRPTRNSISTTPNSAT